ncbi:hypothetical protein A3I95_01725 [Candidatus Nomurabacteria bacterium RIFCSPLOWO2_02_FULL_44_12]|uniref:Transmembrane protein n=1 Tax=Candidatus Nomurabacteria bacterium RIFCSPLOWO2_12_FULL_44_11 TaxID=1801796 RepID=A0A1F6Y6F5_9BACT|nr:MAG: hypothetical protein A3E95_01295 [Candidatus Nomurabacteria bacterium RIFCSPHIGHO2_12_FULL_44_22b]OGJ01938.1 MAG: hypothetical protein A3G53_01470 [Candidatus Nomurabacteria bacterium RIFCSPLOWO2_12_FULL_44_11]OGJ08595.1 MAG: hypothetical protein A3I95_01725 [Candidatus Nomurabacteria bacterium RIFCSPLOWO2_02_FULL_44_12]
MELENILANKVKKSNKKNGGKRWIVSPLSCTMVTSTTGGLLGLLFVGALRWLRMTLGAMGTPSRLLENTNSD